MLVMDVAHYTMSALLHSQTPGAAWWEIYESVENLIRPVPYHEYLVSFRKNT